MLGFTPLNNLEVNGLKKNNWILNYIHGYITPIFKGLSISNIYSSKSILLKYKSLLLNNKYRGILSNLFIKYKGKNINNRYKGK